MADKFKDTKALDKAYMSLAKYYEERKENAIRQIKDGAFVDMLNQEMQELLWQKAGEIAVEIGLEFKARYPEKFNENEPVYANDFGQEIIYNLLGE